MIALVTQKFISDIAMDAMQFSRMRQSSTSAGSSEAARKAASLKVKNINIHKFFFYSRIYIFFSHHFMNDSKNKP